MADPRRPGENAPEIPQAPPPGPELPGRTGAPPGREIPGIPRPGPEEQPQPRRRPGAPFHPNAPGERARRRTGQSGAAACASEAPS